jgi:hypothetical protein
MTGYTISLVLVDHLSYSTDLVATPQDIIYQCMCICM